MFLFWLCKWVLCFWIGSEKGFNYPSIYLIASINCVLWWGEEFMETNLTCYSDRVNVLQLIDFYRLPTINAK